jgi:glycosyltransferase involved in cell wall biosynthesis
MAMNELPLVSIIIPNYNYGDFITAAIESALGQSYPNVEVIVVDDGSTDNSRSVIELFSGRMRPFFQENRGPSAARNTGIWAAGGEWLLFLDSDDVLFPRAVEELMKAYLAVGDGDRLVYGDSLNFDGSAIWPVKRKIPSGRIWRVLIGGNFICSHEALVSRCLAMEVNGFDDSMRMCEDFDFWLRLAQRHEFHHAEVLVAKRRIHQRMTSARADELQCGAGKALEKQWRLTHGFRDKAAIAAARGKNFHLRAYLAKERRDYRAMRNFSFSSIRWQPWRVKNWIYLGYAWWTCCRRAARGGK